MANTSAFRPAGPSVALSVGTGTGATPVTVNVLGNDQVNFVGLLNTNSFPVAVTIGQTTAPTAVLPTAGSPTNTIILGVSMSSPMVVPVPTQNNSFSIAGVAGTSGTIYVTPMVDQN